MCVRACVRACVREEDEELPEEEKYPNLPRPQGPEDSYKRTYDDLTQQIAYRWPNPGSPRPGNYGTCGAGRVIIHIIRRVIPKEAPPKSHP
nr:hypothetical protein BaRGS_013049 [Batillaria attramentaria]